MTQHEVTLIKLFEKYDKESIPGTAYFEAVCDYSAECFEHVMKRGDKLQVKDIHSFISAAYHVGFNRGYDAGRNLEKECKKLED